jgi:hypothetical protein
MIDKECVPCSGHSSTAVFTVKMIPKCKVELLQLWRHSISTLAILLLDGCASTPRPAACFANSSESVGWTLLRNTPGSAVEIRKAAHADSANKQQSFPIEYWFRNFDGSLMLCEPEKIGCGANTTLFDKDESGAMVKSGGFELVCVTAT